VCNKVVCNGEGGAEKPHSKNLHSHFSYVSSTKGTYTITFGQ
jgi:hypothetical protein